MAYKILFCFAAAMIVAINGDIVAQGGLIAAPLPYAVAPYASSYSAHVAHHSIATPVVAGASYVAGPLPVAPSYVAAAQVLPPHFVSPYIESAGYVAGK